MAIRPLLSTAVPSAYQMMMALNDEAERAAIEAGVDPLIVELVRIRVSQLNRSAFCLRLHVRAALDNGEDTDRIAILPAWRGSTYFSEAEQAALDIAEEITDMRPRSGDTVLSPQQEAALCWVAIGINALNHAAIASQYKVHPEP